MDQNEETIARAIDRYRELRPIYQSYSEIVKNILTHALPKHCNLHSIDNRAKKVDSFRKKAEKTEEDTGELKYKDALNEITDLAGVRVIAFEPSALPKICDAIEKNFIVLEKKDLGEERIKAGNFGYKSIHILVQLPPEKIEWAEYQRFDGLTAEIQVRTILQHAWAEMEHDIQYKSAEQIPTTLKQRFVALAGLIEIADREFQAVQDEDTKIRQSLSASLQDDLTTAPQGPGDLKVKNTDQVDNIVQAEKSSSKNARALIAEGSYTEAIDHYTKLITESSNPTHTLYIGRAKAQFLAGKREKALQDLEIAEQLHPGDYAISAVRNQIVDGLLLGPTASTESWQLSSDANEALALGDGEKAFELYSRSQQLGFNHLFSTLNKAMALTLIKDADGANYFLDQFTPHRNSPTEVNSMALRTILSAINKGPYTKNFTELQNKIVELTGYNFGQSPLRHLEKGFLARDTVVPQKIADVFTLLKKG